MWIPLYRHWNIVSDEHMPAFGLMTLHPSAMLNISSAKFKQKTQSFSRYYGLESFDNEAELYKRWKDEGRPRVVSIISCYQKNYNNNLGTALHHCRVAAK
ncbi:unnamed protein product [Chilo suppressalis]|uniref:Uncharacterized protein n=1 Tax=Chilo suppressalis TaxID=168631 RepID=A0ABN8B395_CHISP|nr:unnamed protein product [Chilo suppressalis]